VDICSARRLEELREKVDFVLRRCPGLARQLEAPGTTPVEIESHLSKLAVASADVKAALDLYDEKSSVDRAEGFLADLAEDRSTAPAEIVPLIDQYIGSIRDAIARAWERHVSRRELDACVLQVRLSYSRDLDRILQGLL